MKVKVINKTGRPIDLYNASGAAVTIPPGVAIFIDKSFAINMPRGITIIGE